MADYVERTVQRTRSARWTGQIRHSAWRRYMRIAVIAADALAFVVAVVVTGRLGLFGAPEPGGSLFVLVGSAAWLAVFAVFGLEREDVLPPSVEVRRLTGAVSLGVVLTTVAASSLRPGTTATGVLWCVAMAVAATSRGLAAWGSARLTTSGRIALRTLVIGADDEALRAVRSSAPPCAIDPIGYVRTRSGVADDLEPSLRLGGLDDLPYLIASHDVDRLFVVCGSLPSDEMSEVFRIGRQHGIEVRLLAHVPETLPSRVTVSALNGSMALALRRVRLRGPGAAVKRALDIVVSAAALAVVLVPSLIVMALIRLTSPGPALFRQERVTLGGRRFTIYKFRTMSTDRPSSFDTTTPFFKIENDPRVTRFGAFLRRFSIDELPQLVNVLRGDMSLVGPRPLAADQIDNLPADILRGRGEVKAGLTGWWQVNGRSDVAPDEALALDAFYVENWSLSLDAWILLKTVRTVVAARGAY
jgi:exopolysaccharide biosynthesis polyprenyl glycosylphosphotransferase